MSVYFNNAATTWPKPPCVARAVEEFITGGGANLARGTASERDLATFSVVLECRILLGRLFGGFDGGSPRYVTFCSGVTEALNVVLKGFFPYPAGVRILTSRMEHNAVVRPLRGMERRGATVEFLDCDFGGLLSPGTVKKALERGKSKNGADLVVLSHASNVCGTIQPIEEIAAVCRASGVPLVVDAAQTAGILPLRVAELDLAALCFTGHKGLMGPQGIGGIVWRPDFAERVGPLVEGGTGSYSHIEFQPSDMPDKFEAGTPNLPGIAGLYASVSWLLETGVETVAAHERQLGEYLLTGLTAVDSAVFGGRTTMDGRLPVFSVNFMKDGELMDNGVLADRLALEGFETRPGLHCAPAAHKVLGSFPQGSLRVSPGFFSTMEEIDAFLKVLADLTKPAGR
jgi:cysteine desulfurase family protein